MGDIMIRKCLECDKFLQYIDNDKNNLAYLICPKCRKVFTDEKYITVDTRIKQGYLRYERKEESFAYWIKENFIDNDEF